MSITSKSIMLPAQPGQTGQPTPLYSPIPPTSGPAPNATERPTSLHSVMSQVINSPYPSCLKLDQVEATCIIVRISDWSMQLVMLILNLIVRTRLGRSVLEEMVLDSTLRLGRISARLREAMSCRRRRLVRCRSYLGSGRARRSSFVLLGIYNFRQEVRGEPSHSGRQLGE
jgi:hypothetical protein